MKKKKKKRKRLTDPTYAPPPLDGGNDLDVEEKDFRQARFGATFAREALRNPNYWFHVCRIWPFLSCTTLLASLSLC